LTVQKFRYGLRNAVFVRLTDDTRGLVYRISRSIVFSLKTLGEALRKCSFRNALLLGRALLSGFWFAPKVEFPK
jgi:hypothetical protein